MPGLRNEVAALWLLHQGKENFFWSLFLFQSRKGDELQKKLKTKYAEKRTNFIHFIPRHYLDFIHHFVKLYSEKRSDLEEQQLHLNVGLNKIAETVEQVEEMQKSLAVKSQELQAKNEAANAKLKQMFKDQQEAEKKKVQSQEISIKLADQTVKIEEKRKFVMADLALVEPAVLDAQQGNVLVCPFQKKNSISDFLTAPLNTYPNVHDKIIVSIFAVH